MELSIVIPALNEAANLTRLLPAIHEVARTIVRDYEVIVVDGGSAPENCLQAQHWDVSFQRQ